MSSKVKYAVVGLLSLLMLVCMTGMAGGNDVTTVLRTGDKKAGSENTTVKYSNKESQAPSAMLVGIDIQEMLEAQVDILLAGSGDEPAEEPESAEEPEEIIPSAFDGIAVVTINEAYLRVRADATTESATIGRMYPQSKGTILEEKNGWYHISSGNVDGWISKEFAVTGRAAEEFVKANYDEAVTVATEVLRVRLEPSVDGAFVDYVKEGKTYPVLGEENGWYLIEFRPGMTGYISGEYVTIGAELANAMTMDEVKAYERQKELEAKAERYGGYLREKTWASEEQVYLLAALCRHEAGHRSYEGALAVANVVINRMRNGYWGTSMESVIYAPNQFQYVNDGALNAYLANPPAICIEAARDALDGLNNISDYLFFRSAKTADVSQFTSWVNVGGNIFYKK
ncbi:MAG: SH3 domain-containing protein [Lachnospiraceae bacterium]|nr:SH3 domain-containing protein [Lachnospiraceae bacterium]